MRWAGGVGIVVLGVIALIYINLPKRVEVVTVQKSDIIPVESFGPPQEINERPIHVSSFQTAAKHVDTRKLKPGESVNIGKMDVSGETPQRMACYVEFETASRFCLDEALQRKILTKRKSVATFKGQVKMRFTSKLSPVIAALPGPPDLTTYQVLDVLEQ